jgi:hypothetical protein
VPAITESTRGARGADFSGLVTSVTSRLGMGSGSGHPQDRTGDWGSSRSGRPTNALGRDVVRGAECESYLDWIRSWWRIQSGGSL